MTIIVLIFLCYIPTLFIQSLVNDRQQYAITNEATYNTNTLHIQTSEVTDYRAIMRATKYAILFIALTFATFFLFEVLAGLKLHPINYGLVGLALGTFYLLLLSFSEIIGFIPAYLLSAAAVVTLIVGYITAILREIKKIIILSTTLTGLYAYLLILLQLEQFSLLFGSLLVFGTLTTLMMSTRHIDWHKA